MGLDGQRAWRELTANEPRDRLLDLPPVPRNVPLRPFYRSLCAVLSDAIVDRVFRQGERLPPSAAIASRFGCSVDTARAALRTLAGQGMVEKVPDGGWYVRGPSF
jgi:GntR family transcriptional repressor for pyruvate dehydrogenase complex